MLAFAENSSEFLSSNCNLHNVMHICTSTNSHFVNVCSVHFWRGDRAIIHVCSCAQTFSSLRPVHWTSLQYRHSSSHRYIHPEACSWQEPGDDNESKRGSIKSDSRRSWRIFAFSFRKHGQQEKNAATICWKPFKFFSSNCNYTMWWCISALPCGPLCAFSYGWPCCY